MTSPLLPPPTGAQQAQIAILRAIAYRVAHPSERHPLSWWQEQQRDGTMRFTLDIETSDLRDLIARITKSPIGRQPRQRAREALKPGKSEPLPPQPRR
jgi:hypothetical protein